MTNHHSATGPSLLTIEEVCYRTGLGRTKVRDLIANGDLDAVRLGHRTLRVTAASFEAFLTRLGAASPEQAS